MRDRYHKFCICVSEKIAKGSEYFGCIFPKDKAILFALKTEGIFYTSKKEGLVFKKGKQRMLLPIVLFFKFG